MNIDEASDYLTFVSYMAQRDRVVNGESCLSLDALIRRFPNGNAYEARYQKEQSGELTFLGASCTVPAYTILEG